MTIPQRPTPYFDCPISGLTNHEPYFTTSSPPFTPSPHPLSPNLDEPDAKRQKLYPSSPQPSPSVYPSSPDFPPCPTPQLSPEATRLTHLIRSTTSLLSLLNHTASLGWGSEGVALERRVDRHLDKVAGVMGTGTERVACLGRQGVGEYSVFYCVQGEDEEEEVGPEWGVGIEKAERVEVEGWKERVFDDYLQSFANNHLLLSNRKARRSSTDQTRLFVLANTIPRFLKLLRKPIHPGTRWKFLDLFDRETVKEEEFRAEFKKGKDWESGGFDERKLVESIKQFGLENKLDNNSLDGHIILTKHTIGHFHTYICKLLQQLLQLADENILPFYDPDGDNENTVDDLEADVLMLEWALKVLRMLVVHSSSWDLYLTQPVLGRRISELAKQTQHSMDDESRRKCEKVIRNPIQGLCDWLEECLAQFRAVAGLVEKVRSPVQFYKVAGLPTTTRDGQQASLKDLVAAIATDGKLEEKLRDLARYKTLMEERSDPRWRTVLDGSWEHSFEGEYCPEAILCCLKSNKNIDNRIWRNGTCPQAIRNLQASHPNPTSFLMLIQNQSCTPTLGLSHPTTYPTLLYARLTLTDSALDDSATTGHITPWSPPPWEDRLPILEQLWTALKSQLIEKLQSEGLVDRVVGDWWGADEWGNCEDDGEEEEEMVDDEWEGDEEKGFGVIRMDEDDEGEDEEVDEVDEDSYDGGRKLEWVVEGVLAGRGEDWRVKIRKSPVPKALADRGQA
ncbi:hypothetical protein BJ508DRAFT_310957 [Ascobolus immersus RN42]|uniref:Uncharacterized protein n=1 Tax=Ascobolus immersus RN42 TaxID=1160509 RepID=A0A3N4HRV0_ASCIM|nr:hypothetical protein BJ508DRAFT_310957 [Ascobolus immersus RN42]